MIRIVISLLIALSLTACSTTHVAVNKFQSHCPESSKEGKSSDDHLPYFKAAPLYPLKAFRQRREGYAEFEFDISAEGRPINLWLIESYPADIFVRAAYVSLQMYKYKPVYEDGKAVISRCHSAKIVFAIEK